MWFGTADGLTRYDGTNSYLYEYNPKIETSLCHNNINAIIEDSDQRLWIGTSNGLCIYNREKDNFINIDSIAGNKNYLNNRYVTALSFDHDGKLWIGTLGGGVNIYDPSTKTFTYFGDNPINSKNSVPTNYITSLLCVDDLMWCGTKGGLKLFSTSRKAIVPMSFIDASLPISQITQLVSDKVGNIWLSTVNGEIIKLIPGNGYYSFETVFSGNSINSGSWNNILTLAIDAKGNFWIAGANSGLNYLDTKTVSVTRYLSENNQAPTNSIRTVYIDNTGLVWIGTYSKGVYLIHNNLKKFQQYQQDAYKEIGLENKSVGGFTQDAMGNIWVAVEGLGLCKMDIKTNSLQECSAINRKISNKYLTSVICDRYGNLWIGSGRGVYMLDPRTNDVKNYSLQSNGFGDNKIFYLHEDRAGTIWVGTAGSGLFYFDKSQQSFINLSEEDKPNYISSTAYVTSIIEDSDGVLWVGTMYGLYALKRNADNSFDYSWHLSDSRPGSLSSCGIQALYEDRKKNLWIGTTDNGLNVKSRNSATFKVFTKKDGLPSNTIRAIVMDAAGNLWVSGNMGLSKFNEDTNTFVNYSREDGLTSNNFNSNACIRSSTGELFFGSNNGFNAFYPDSIRTSSDKPVVYLSDLKINNQSVPIATPGSPLKKHISLTSEIELSYEQRSFMIDFVALNYGQSPRHSYCYKLEGFDKTWNCTGPGHSANYTNIDPGNYVFYVKASNSDGISSEVPARLNITIRPLIWKTWWAIASYIIVFALIVFVLIKTWMERVNMKNQLSLERLAREQEHALSESKTLFFTNISHEFRTPLSLILMPLESLIAGDQVPPFVKERIFTAYKSADKMMHLVNELMDFNKLESGTLKINPQYGELVSFIQDTASVFTDVSVKRNIRFSVNAEVQSLKGWFDRDKVEKILVNILSNAFKFTADGGQITVIINACDASIGEEQALSRCLELTVVDNGIGISSEEIPRIFDKFYQAKSAAKIPNPGTGIGLSLTKGLVELHRGNITAESKPDSDTRFTITLPIDRHIYQTKDEEQNPVDVLSTEHEVQTENDLHHAHYVHDHTDTGSNENADRPEILIVEDNDELREYLSAELGTEFSVLEAKDGSEGLDVALAKCPDLIISDILMPNKTGTELCRALKVDLKTSHIPVILLTAKATIEDQITGIKTGADAYITKPFSIRFLTAHVKQIIESRQKLYRRFSQDVYLLPGKVASNEIDKVFLQKAIDFIMENLQNPQLGVDSIANLFNLSRMQVYRKIKALTGKSVVEFIRMVRVKQALKLMDTHKFTLSEIAFQAGFSSSSYFTRCFKEEYGKTPSQYLEQA